MKISGIRLLGFALGLAVSGVVFAQDASPIQITSAVFQEVEVKAADGAVSKKLVPATAVVPGGEVVYEITYQNSGDDTATDVVIDNPLPEELSYVGSSVPVDAFSIDGGKTFGNLADLKVEGADGPRAAEAADVTNLRWIVDSLAPGAKGMVGFRAKVK